MSSEAVDEDDVQRSYPTDLFALRENVSVPLSSVRMVNQKLAKAVLEKEARADRTKAVFQVANEDVGSTMTVHRVTEDAYLLEVFEGSERYYFEATANLLGEDLSLLLATEGWTVDMLDGKMIESFLAAL